MTFMWGEKAGEHFQLNIFKMVTSISRNNNLSPDCLSTLKVGAESGTGGIRMEAAQVKENLHALDLFYSLNLFLAPIWNSTQCPQRLSLFHTLQQRSRGHEVFFIVKGDWQLSIASLILVAYSCNLILEIAGLRINIK